MTQPQQDGLRRPFDTTNVLLFEGADNRVVGRPAWPKGKPDISDTKTHNLLNWLQDIRDAWQISADDAPTMLFPDKALPQYCGYDTNTDQDPIVRSVKDLEDPDDAWFYMPYCLYSAIIWDLFSKMAIHTAISEGGDPMSAVRAVLHARALRHKNASDPGAEDGGIIFSDFKDACQALGVPTNNSNERKVFRRNMNAARLMTAQNPTLPVGTEESDGHLKQSDGQTDQAGDPFIALNRPGSTGDSHDFPADQDHSRSARLGKAIAMPGGQRPQTRGWVAAQGSSAAGPSGTTRTSQKRQRDEPQNQGPILANRSFTAPPGGNNQGPKRPVQGDLDEEDEMVRSLRHNFKRARIDNVLDSRRRETRNLTLAELVASRTIAAINVQRFREQENLAVLNVLIRERQRAGGRGGGVVGGGNGEEEDGTGGAASAEYEDEDDDDDDNDDDDGGGVTVVNQ